MQDLIIQADISIKEALKQMSRGAEKCLIVVDENSALQGTLSDGDLRNAILSGKDISSSIEDLYNKNPTFFKKINIQRKE